MMLSRSKPLAMIALVLGGWIGLRVYVHAFAAVGAAPGALPPALVPPLFAPVWTGSMGLGAPAVASFDQRAARTMTAQTAAHTGARTGAHTGAAPASSRSLTSAHIDASPHITALATSAVGGGVVAGLGGQLHRSLLARLSPQMFEAFTPSSGAMPRLAQLLGAPTLVQPPQFDGAPPAPSSAAQPLPNAAGRRWSINAVAFFRDSASRGLRSVAPQLGGSQQVLTGRLALSRDGRWAVQGRVIGAGNRTRPDEAALAIIVQPLRAVPLHLVAERRVALAAGGRNATALYATTGASAALPDPAWRADAYGAAGVVGLRRGDSFAEGSARLTRTIASTGGVTVEGGGASWGAAQPGAARVDIGPTLTVRGTRSELASSVTLDWRHRIAGNARPASGPAVTLSVGF